MEWSNTTASAGAASSVLTGSPASSLPPLPSYTLTPREPIYPGVPDGITILFPVLVVYWVVSLFFHFLDVYDLFPQYRLHTPLEVLQRNPVSRADVVRDVLLQQIVQTIAGAALAYFDDVEYTGKEGYDVAVWALRLRKLCGYVPSLLGLIGVDAVRLAGKVSATAPTLAGILLGGKYPNLTQTIVDVNTGAEIIAPAFAGWELKFAEVLYYYAVPALQFFVATCIVDSWQYFLHRAMHMNKWLYATFHSRHHRLYVPYAFGALYNHPVEGFLLDTAGTGLAYLVTGLSARQAMFFFTGSTIKTIDDHCGYRLPFDPLQLITGNNAAYHDIHHQSWGIKTNFSQPFFTFWDTLLGTVYKGDPKEMEKRYARGRERAEVAARAAAAAEKEKGEKAVLGSVEVNEDTDNDALVVKKGVLVSERVVGISSLGACGSDESDDY
ncbi:hypothetical protein KEM56_005224 [Ascosphaera pollenicola]|nr:hypothetical protein KEM56_005224 [Ascosphaera pollenicola]